MSDLPFEPPPLAAAPARPDTALEADIRAALGLGILSVGGLSAISLLVGGSPRLALSVLVAPTQIAVHLTLLSLPALLVMQAWAGVAVDLPGTARALIRGTRDGAALLAATMPLVLFFGASMPHRLVVIALVFVSAEVSLLAGLFRAWTGLARGVDLADLRPALVASIWAVLAAAIAMLCAIDFYRHLLEAR